MEQEAVLNVIRQLNPAVEPQLSSRLATDLHFDSLDIYELATGVEDELHFNLYGLALDNDVIENWLTVEDVVRDVVLLNRIGKRARDSHFDV